MRFLLDESILIRQISKKNLMDLSFDFFTEELQKNK